MWYVGLDVHARTSSYCILDENGKKVKARTVRGSPKMVIAELSKIKRRVTICFEASASYGYIYDQLSKTGARVVVAHPGGLRLIFRSKHKNDRIDAEKLAKLLYLDEVPPVWVPSAEVRSWRGLIMHRSRLVSRRAAVKNRLRAFLRGRGIEAPKGLWSQRGQAAVKALAFENDMDAVERDSALLEIADLETMIGNAERLLNRQAASHPGVQLLQTIPGVGPRTAEAVVAYMDDPRRFKNCKAVGRYFGVVAREDSSGGKQRLGHISKEGPAVVRRLLNQASWRAIQHDARVRAFAERIQRGDPQRKKIAIVATMHFLLRAMYAMLRDGTVWRSSAA